MSVLLFSDLHAHPWQEFSETVDYRGSFVSSRLVDALKVLRKIRKTAVEREVEGVIFAGDLFHRKRYLDAIVYDLVVDQLRRLANVADVWLMVGNHDLAQAGLWTDRHSLSAVLHKRIHIVSAPTKADIGKYHFGLIPYAPDTNEVLWGIEQVQDVDAYVLHAGISGAMVGAMEYQPAESLKPGDLPTVPVFSGHYHLPQVIERRGSPIMYVGAPLEISRNERATFARGFVLLDNLEEPERIRYSGPRFVSIEYEKGKEYPKLKGNFVDVVYDPDQTPADVVTDAVRQYHPRAINLIPRREEATVRSRLKIRSEKGKIPPIEELCDRYVDAAEDLGTLDPKKLKAIGKEILSQTSEEDV